MTTRNVPKSVSTLLSQGGADLTEVTFRPAREADAPAMYEMSRRLMRTGALISRDPQFFTASLGELFVMEVDREVVACSGIRRFDNSAEIFNVVVAARWQGRGLGRLLLASLVKLLYDEGFADVVLFSKSATRWFEQLGFVPADPAILPAERRAMVDAERGSVLLRRPTVGGVDGRQVLAKLTGLRVRFQRSGVECRWSALSDTDSLLKLADRNGVEVDSLCWGGICGTCSSPLKRGTVSYDVEPEVQPEHGEVLLCIAQPVTDLVVDR